MDILETLTSEFNLKRFQVDNTVKLIDDGNTIPFIARYRKELTGSLDDQVLRSLQERLTYLRGLNDKREQVRASIAGAEKLTDEISRQLDAASTLAEIEDIYRPFRPKRRTRATVARERGLEPLAYTLLAQAASEPPLALAREYVNAELEVNTPEEALKGAMDILAEIFSDDANYRAIAREESTRDGVLVSKASDPKKESVYTMYYDFQEPIKKIAGHRVLAINRGETEEFLNVRVETPDERIIARLCQIIVKNNPATEEVIREAAEDSYRRLIAPSMERELRSALTERAEEGALKIFSENLRQLLLQPPIKDKVVLALDPGYRTGCKVAVIDGTGRALDTDVIYATPPQNRIEESKAKLAKFIAKHNVDVIAIGNGTASRETEAFVAGLFAELNRPLAYVIVNEAGASVYSASKLGAEEFPEYDVSLRSAISIGRRLQDPLAELVKIDPKSIGVGQYQHDMNQKRLGETLGGVVEGCVNSVGVNLNTASPSLLSYVAGITSATAKNILAYREQNGAFKSRAELLNVKKLGPKAYEQCAGFLRIPDGANALDNTGVHPESYAVSEKLLKLLGLSLEDVRAKKARGISKMTAKLDATAAELGVGAPTLADIIKELEKPGRDPREDLPPPILRGDVLSIENLYEGMVLSGTVRNITDFGAFVDIGVHQDGLVHISQMSDRYIKHPLEAVRVGEIIKVKVLGVNKNKISLSMKI
ncbi:MAG: RNA-binding transcriptional accessory protein [Clostridiales bacterium]|jgi:uncharacterized protein|nr:RNA-binding transcriptional accessory protein [Clostridiales bacterium]